MRIEALDTGPQRSSQTVASTVGLRVTIVVPGRPEPSVETNPAVGHFGVGSPTQRG